MATNFSYPSPSLLSPSDAACYQDDFGPFFMTFDPIVSSFPVSHSSVTTTDTSEAPITLPPTVLVLPKTVINSAAPILTFNEEHVVLFFNI